MIKAHFGHAIIGSSPNDTKFVLPRIREKDINLVSSPYQVGLKVAYYLSQIDMDRDFVGVGEDGCEGVTILGTDKARAGSTYNKLSDIVDKTMPNYFGREFMAAELERVVTAYNTAVGNTGWTEFILAHKTPQESCSWHQDAEAETVGFISLRGAASLWHKNLQGKRECDIDNARQIATRDLSIWKGKPGCSNPQEALWHTEIPSTISPKPRLVLAVTSG